MSSDWELASVSFAQNTQSVFQLLDFDRVIVDTAVGGLRALAHDLEERGQSRTAITLVNNRASLLENIRTESLRPNYETMFNQCLVLLVSYFGSVVHGVFRAGVVAALKSGSDVAVAREALTVSWRGLERSEGDRETIFTDLLISQKGVSFQDMKSIARAFGDLLGIPIARTSTVNNLVLGLAARHVIVHAGSVVDDRMARQVAGAHPRSLMQQVVVGSTVRFTPAEIRELAANMSDYVDALCRGLRSCFPLPSSPREAP